MKRIFTFLLIAFSLVSCSKNDSPKYSGESVITTRLYISGSDYITYGFSFKKAKNIPYSMSMQTNDFVDIIALPLTNNENKLTGVIFSSTPQNDKAFLTNGEFSDENTAISFFNNYKEVTGFLFKPLSDTIKVYQVLTYKSLTPTYAKILITSVKFLPDNLTGQYAEVTFRWVYQPDGTTLFP